tara:strand:+ start:131 stop:778 length:648 start_codon:yes stop_codon:yes gene_type:complete
MKLLLAIMLLLPMLSSCDKGLPETDFSYKVLQEIDNPIILDHVSLLSEEGMGKLTRDIISHLEENQVMKIHPLLGAFFNPAKRGFNINVIIESNGGYAGIAKGLIGMLSSFKRAGGIEVTCYVNTAQSAAFTVMLGICDKKIGIGNVTLMQHRAYYSGIGYTSGTLLTDMELAKIEADVVKVNINEWLKITRDSYEDHAFTKKEIEKYKLLDKVL